MSFRTNLQCLRARRLAVTIVAGDTAGTSLFWVPWPIGGLLCGVVALIVEIIKRRSDR